MKFKMNFVQFSDYSSDDTNYCEVENLNDDKYGLSFDVSMRYNNIGFLDNMYEL